MSDQTKIYIAGIGMITPVGANAQMTAAAVKAGVSGYRISEYINNACQPITMAMVPDDALPKFIYDLETSEDINIAIGRMLLMASIALEETIMSYQGNIPLPLILAGPTTYAGQEVPFSYKFIDQLVMQSGIELDRANSRLIATGRSGVLAGIGMAIKYLSQGMGDYVLVGGVDSYQDYNLLLQLDQQGRIRTEEAPDGFVPGEASAFLMLTHKAELAKIYGKYTVCLSVPGIAEEAGHLYSKETYTGDGLADAIRVGINNGDDQKIHTIYSSMNGEHVWAKEYGVAMLRNKNAMAENVRHEHPADCFGDIGAAMGAVLVGIAGLEMARDGAPQKNIVYCSSDHAQRAAVCLSLVT